MRSAIGSCPDFFRKWGGSMKKNLLLIRANLRKAKGQAVAIVVLVLLSSLMMNLWLMLSMDYKKNFDRCHDRLNDGHVNLAAYSADEKFREFVTDMLERTSGVTEVSVTDAFCAPVSFQYGGGEVSQFAAILEKEDALSREVGKYEITGEDSFGSGVYVPMLYGTGNNYAVGDTIELTLFGKPFEYTVCGFFNSAMTGSHNCGILSFLLSGDKFREFSEESCAVESTYISLRLEDKMQGEEIEASLRKAISEEFPDIMLAGNYYEDLTTSRYISQMICAGITSAMAFFVLLIGLVVIASNVVNYIQENMQNLGALKAVGYTGRQLVFSLILQFSGLSAVTAVVGIALSYCIFPALNKMMIAQTGIPYTVRFLPVPCLITIVFSSGIVAAAVYVSAGKMKKIEPITALRQGITTHNFRRNHVPLEKTRLPLQPALAMKTTLSGLKTNITICITMLVLSLILVFSGLMYKNMIMDMKPFIDLIAGESADSCININAGREEEFLSILESDSRVEKFYLFTNNLDAQHVGGVSLMPSVIEDGTKLNNQKMVIEGRFPEYDNEIVIAVKYAREKGLRIGDEITIKIGGKDNNYIITGFSQVTNNLGKDCILTRGGYEKAGSLQNVSYYMDLTDGTDIDAFNSEVTARFGNDVNATFNILAVIEGTGNVYVSLMTIIVIAILALSGVVIVFVLYLLVRTLLNVKKRDYGILKALGFTTRQLILQTALSFMPSMTISVAIGIFISMQIVNPLTALFLNGVGIVRCTFEISLVFNIIAGGVLLLFAFAAACLLSLRIRRITPRALLSGE